MTPAKLRPELVAERASWIRTMVVQLRAIPLSSYDAFAADARNPAAAESYLRRALEALLDLGRHVLAKGFGRAATEYKEIADGLVEVGVVDPRHRQRLRDMASRRTAASRWAGPHPPGRYRFGNLATTV
ncbi:MAG TPA: HepT-like ribonuclease domain-containing protein [Longimicrobiales bacterium]|jgi:uncharacterized protein YutE (UPF0331/DUF86 family)